MPNPLPALVEEGLQYFEQAGDAGDRQYVKAIRAALSAPALTADQYVQMSGEEMIAFHRFIECCEDMDADGHDVPKEMMARLAKIGVVRHAGRGIYETTAFGDALLAQKPASASIA